MVGSMFVFASRFSPDVTERHIENSLREDLQLTSLTCAELMKRTFPLLITLESGPVVV
jgi:hypothetical protein